MGEGRHKRGLAAARRIETTAQVVREARSHAKEAEVSELRDVARRQLKKLRNVLNELQRLVLRDGLSKDASEHLNRQLEALEHSLTTEAIEPVDDAALERLVGCAKAARLDLKARLR